MLERLEFFPSVCTSPHKLEGTIGSPPPPPSQSIRKYRKGAGRYWSPKRGFLCAFLTCVNEHTRRLLAVQGRVFTLVQFESVRDSAEPFLFLPAAKSAGAVANWPGCQTL